MENNLGKGLDGRDIRAAVIGCGHLGRYHSQKYLALKAEVSLVAVCDILIEKASEFVSKLAVPSSCVAISDYKELIHLNLDCVSIATDTNTHFEIASFFIENGVDVLLEKPMTQDLKSASILVAHALRVGKILQIGHIERFNPAVKKVKDYLISPWFFEVKRIAPYKPRGTDVDVVLDLMIHDIDLLLYLINKPVVKIDAVGIPVLTQSVDIANARFEFEGGIVANISASRVSPHSERSFRIFQPDSYIALDLEAKKVKRLERNNHVDKLNSADLYSMIQAHEEELTGDALQEEIKSFIQSVRTRTIPFVTGEDGCRVMEIIEEVQKQMKISAGKFNHKPEELMRAVLA